MSGEKRITINNADYRRLLQSESQLRAIQHDLPEVLSGVLREGSAELQRRLEPLERRQRDFQNAISSLSSDVRNLERETAQRLEQQHREMRRALQDTENRLRQETRTLIAEQERRLTSLVEQERRTREQQVHNLQQQINSMVANEQRKVELAKSWVDTAQVMRDFIEKNYRHRQFAPGQLERLERDIKQAVGNISQNTPEAAISQAQSAYNGLSDLRLELERLEQEWHLWRNAALESVKGILAVAQSNRKCQALDIEGKNTGIDIEVDWWTKGKLSELEKELNGIIAKIGNDHTPMSTDELRDMVEKAGPDLRRCLEEIIQEARLAVVSSQIRINIADLVVQALEEKGFSIQDGTYEGQDMRNGYAAKVKALNDSEVVVLVTPVEDEPGQNELRIHSYDEGLVTSHELQSRARAVNESLRTRGLEVSEPQATGAVADQSLRNMEVVRRGEHLQQRVAGR